MKRKIPLRIVLRFSAAILGVVLAYACGFYTSVPPEPSARLLPVVLITMAAAMLVLVQGASTIVDFRLEEIHRKIIEANLRKPSLRADGLALASEMRKFVASLPNENADLTFIMKPFLDRFWPRLRDIKDRFAVVLPRWNVESSTNWLPTSADRI